MIELNLKKKKKKLLILVQYTQNLSKYIRSMIIQVGIRKKAEKKKKKKKKKKKPLQMFELGTNERFLDGN